MPAFHDEELIEVGGYRLTLAIDFSIIDLVEHLSGQEMPQVLLAVSADRPPIGVAGKLLWALLRRNHGSMTLDETAGLMLGKHRPAVLAGMFGLLKRAMNLGEKKPEDGSSKATWSIRDFLIEWVAVGGSPADFWRQTPYSFVTVMEGMVQAANREIDLSITTAWHTAIFIQLADANQLRGKKLSDFLTSAQGQANGRSRAAEAIAFFHGLKARGVPVEITRH